ncbi:LOW QUALITY PROTEIN: leukocyte elastase inhibitor-like [Cariama cristata]
MTMFVRCPVVGLGHTMMGSLSAANAKFCLDFFKELSKVKRNENFFFSPLSISAALSMVQLGAGGNTAEEMEKVLHIHEVLSMSSPGMKSTAGKCEEAGGAHSQFQELLSALGEAGATCSLSIANRLFGEVTFQFLHHYLNSTRALYHAELEAVDFINAAEESRRKMNSWVEKQTGKIKDLLPPGSIDSKPMLALVNAIHFKGQWTVKFEEKNTREMPFRLNKRENKNVPMMSRTGKYKLARIEEEQVTVLELPYTGEELSMFILLPENISDESTGLEQLECTLTYEKLAGWTSLARMQQLRVKVYLPQFKMEESYVLNKTLQEMGVMNVFDWGKADLSGISRKDGLVVSKAIQKSFVEVNEEGTEAVGAMGLIAVPLCRPVSYEFKADHPFLFFIRHNPANTILFFGRYSSP